jgi:hypothetical protein
MPIELRCTCIWRQPDFSAYDKVDAENPTWDQVDAAIRALDGAARNDLYFHVRRDDLETYLAVGGGNGRYIVTGAIENETFPTVISGPESAQPRVHLMVGGQMGDYPHNYILTLDTTLRAVHSFVDTCKFGGGGVLWYDA